MRILIAGFGTVGKAQAHLITHLGHKVFVFDPIKKPENITPARNVDLTFICVLEHVVENAIKNLIENKVKGLYVIKSTVPIGETERLSRKFGIHICCNPEFLRGQFAFDDVLHPSRIVIGQCCEEHGVFLKGLYSPLKTIICRTTPVIAETVKLVSNTYLSTLITFWNQVYELTRELDIETKQVARLVTLDKRMSEYGTKFFGKPFDGKCLAKDLNHLIDAFSKSPPTLLQAIRDFNRRLSHV